MKTGGTVIALLVLGLFLVAVAVGQDVPQLINYQGKLMRDGKPVNGEVGITFVIYDDSTADAQELWSEYQTVPVTGGHYNVLLGIVNHFEDGDSVFLGDERYLGIKVGNDPEMRPRMRIASVGFALNADKVDGEDASHFLPAEDLDHLDAADGDPANVVYVDSAGKVGIGTTGPGAKLDVNGTVKAKKFEFTGGGNAGQFPQYWRVNDPFALSSSWQTAGSTKSIKATLSDLFPNYSDMEVLFFYVASFKTNTTTINTQLYYYDGAWKTLSLASSTDYSFFRNYRYAGSILLSDYPGINWVQFQAKVSAGTSDLYSVFVVFRPIY